MNAAALRAMEAVISPGSVPALRKLLVMLTLRRATGASSCGTKDVSIAASELEVPSSLTGVGCFVPLSEIAEVAKGPTGIKGAKPGPYPLVVTAEDRGTCDHYDFEGEAVLVPMVSSTGHGDASLKRIHYQEGRFAVGSILAAIQVRDPGNYSPRFLYEYLSSFKDELLVARMSGTANVSLTVKKIAAVPVPVIRIADQRRLHDLMRLCDALEAKGRLEAQQHARLLETLLATLTDSTTPEELAANWQRVAEHFDLLLDRPEAVDALEQTILQLAVRGLLVSQDAKEEPAIEPLRRLDAQRAKEDWGSRARQADSGQDENSEQPPFVLPAGWVWAKAQDLTSPASIITYGVLKPEWVEVGVPTVRVQDIQAGNLLTNQVGQCSRSRAEKFARTRLNEGDLLVAKDGATLGKTAFVPKALEGGNITQHVLRFSIAPSFNRDYVRLVIDAPHGQTWMRGETQGVALPGVNVGDFRRMPIPVPPIAEQARIVARVTELRRLCADLRQRLATSQATQSRLAGALVESVVSA